MSQTITLDEVMKYEAPDLLPLALAVDEKAIINGMGRPLNVPLVITRFGNTFNKMLEAIKNKRKVPSEFFIPDVWHITLGQAKMFPKGDGQMLWETVCKARQIADLVYKRSLGLPMGDTVTGFPGCQMAFPKDMKEIYAA